MSDPFAEAAMLMADSRYALGREYTAPLGSSTLGRLELPRGSTHLTLRGGADPATLFQARFASPMAEIVSDQGTVHVVYRHHGGSRKREKLEGLILLNANLPWAINCTGGTAFLRADLRQLTITAIAISHGVSDVVIDLGAPSGAVPINIRGGVSQVTIRRPQGIAARLRVRGGAAKLAFDQQFVEASGGTIVLATPEIERATARYDIEMVGGVSDVNVLTIDDQPAVSPSLLPVDEWR